ncbi:hypothetical protein CHI12_09465 [Terribacillus saccharophilus]|uniref:Restriction endonuclease n=1 Tax=Terribacillus saccharophilus TaxID=361277 RepID=A0A268HD30_9BACI|nr:hypothetical protein [Terribacillus saccharophilus]PAE07785.1 hypothetical protein CHI12_09465 [Terribacillus saccharophilus]
MVADDKAVQKLDEVINKSWDLFIQQFVQGKYSITKEAPFQFHFADTINKVGNLYCFKRGESFSVDLETRKEGILGKNKYIDITCAFYNGEEAPTASAAIELKFKKNSQGADDEARIDAYLDIQALEACEDHFDLAYFFMITESEAYSKPSKKLGSTADIFSMRNNYIPPVNKVLIPKLESRSKKQIVLKKAHEFQWQSVGKNVFLKLDI